MKNKSYGEQIKKDNVMLSGLKANQEKLAKRGIDAIYIEKYEKLLIDCTETNNAQEKAKADLYALTEKLNKLMFEMEKEFQFAKRTVMSDIPSSEWNAFGFKKPDNRPKGKAVNPQKKDAGSKSQGQELQG